MSKKDLIKITFTGDIMCEMPLLKKTYDQGQYDFDLLFENVQPIFLKSDFVVGNLETICAGKELGYTNQIYSFNTPASFLNAIKKSGIGMVSTATNHALDRGIIGLKRNLHKLKESGIDSIGTYISKESRDQIYIKKISGMNISFLNYTYGTNVHINGQILDENELFHLGLLKSQKEEVDRFELKQNPKSLKGKLAKTLFKYISLEKWFKIKKIITKKFNVAYQDNDLSHIDPEYLSIIKNEIVKAKESSDFLVVCMHSGGQFHPEPGDYSRYMMNFMYENGVDLVIGNHAHVVQKHEVFKNGMFGAYSLGNFSISPSSVYVIHDDYPEYSILPHIYIDTRTKKIKKVTFSILKIVETLKDMTVQPIDKLDKVDEEALLTIYNRFTNKNEVSINIENEYLLYEL